MLRCTGCGSTGTIAEIQAKHPNAISCCPERDMQHYLPRAVTIRLIPREDGGLRVCSDDVPGLILSHSKSDQVMASILPALSELLARNSSTSKD